MALLLSKADVFIDHLPETMKQLHLDERTIMAQYPHLI